MKNTLESMTCLKKNDIQQYLNNDLSNTKRHWIEDHLLDCPFCSDAVEGFQKHYNFEMDNDLANLEKTLQQKATTLEEAKRIPIRSTNSIFTFNRIAAAIILLVIGTAGLNYWNVRTINDGYQPIGLNTLRSPSTDAHTNEQLIKVVGLYKADQFEAALTLTEEILDREPDDIVATYYAGLSALAAEQYELAADYFMTLRLNSEFHFEDATWLMAQACLGANRHEKALKILEEIIANPANQYYDEAVELKRDIGER